MERPPLHWSALALYLGVLVLLLVVHGLSTQTTGASQTRPPAGTVSPLEGQRAIVTVQNGRLVSRQPPPGRRLALTFDDGPDPVWTPRIASTLRRLGATGTFFPLGSRVVQNPGLVRQLRADGFEIGNHTFNHADLSRASNRERSLQVSLTETALAGAAGVRPRLFRPPFSSEPSAITPQQAPSVVDIAEDGYLIALSDYDSEDWRRPGVEEIVRNAAPRGGQGGIVLLHDGGGDRSETVAALERLVPRLRERGFRFVRVSDLLSVSPAEVEVPATAAQRARGRLLIAALEVAGWITGVLTALLIPIGVLAVVRALLLLAVSRRHARRWRRRRPGEEFAPPASIVVPAYNESAGIERAVLSLRGSAYPQVEVIVVDDGSEDGTGDIVSRLGLPDVRVIRQPNSGKPAALNAGVAAARHDLVVTVDGDTVFEPDTLRRLVEPFRDPDMGAAAGNTKVGNRRGLLGRWQHIEYVMGFNLDRRLYDVLQCMPTVPGAVGCFRREALDDAGGFSAGTLAEDTDITMAIGRAGWRVVFVEDARAWTEAPATLAGLWRQRYRWSYGTLQAVWKHRAAMWRRGERRIGWRGIPYLVLFQVLLPLLAPVIDVFALYGLLFLDPLQTLAFWAGFNVLLLALAAYAFRLDGESLRPLWAMPLGQLVYRQLMYLVVLQAVVSAFLGARLRWQHLERTGRVQVAR